MSSGITRPFGRLSRSPGYVSDSLLTRSPLGLAAPCDLHVLATPPAFRLSQDQTLQLNFLARADPDARCDRCRLTETDTFTGRVILETSLSIPARLRLFRVGWLLPARPARAGGSATRVEHGGQVRRLNGVDARLKHISDGLLKLK